MTGAAKNTADECACSASTAATVAVASHFIDESLPPNSTKAIDVFTKATARGGLQIVALSAMSNGAVAMKSANASASDTDPARVHSAASSSASAAVLRAIAPGDRCAMPSELN